MSTLGVGGSRNFLSWCKETGWRPLLFRHCTHPDHQHKKHLWSRMKGYRLYQLDANLTGEQLREPVQREQVCEYDLVREWNAISRTGMATAPGNWVGH